MLKLKTPLLPWVNKMVPLAAPFQLEDAVWAAKRKRVVLGHKTGLGKTFMTLLAWGQWADVRRVLIIGSASSLTSWRRVLRDFGGHNPVILKGGDDINWSVAMDKSKFGVWLLTAATFRMLMEKENKKQAVKGLKSKAKKHIPFDLLITDELHRYLRHKTNTWEAIKQIDSTYYIGATATWASKGPQDLWPVMNYIDKTEFSSYWKWVSTWCHTSEGFNGSKEIIAVKNGPQLKQYLTQYYRARTWKEVGHQFNASLADTDPFVRRTEYVDMDTQQARLYGRMEEVMEARIGTGARSQYILAQNSLDKLTKLMQLALDPRLLLADAEAGGGTRWLVEKVTDMESAVIFVPYKGLQSLIEADITDMFKSNGQAKRPVYKLYGGMSPDEQDETIAAWKASKGYIICTISYAQSFSLDAADHAFMFGFSWDPNDNIQAEGRMRRFDSVFTVPCLVTYIVVQDTVYQSVKDVINGKVAMVQEVLNKYAQ